MDEEDRLSALPDDIIHRILSCLTIDAAVRTSILSGRWRHQWKFVSLIHFPSLRELERGIGYCFVEKILSLLRAPKISKFIVVAHVGLHVESDFGNWISFAVSRHVPSLELYLEVDVKRESWNYEGRPEHFKLPDSFYLEDTESRKNITLSCVEFNPPAPELGFQGYQFLTRLFLYDSSISDGGLESVVSTCKILKSLSIIKCSGLNHPRISSMSLLELVYTVVTDYLHSSRTDAFGIKFEIDVPNLVSLNAFCELTEIIVLNGSCCPLEVRLLEPREVDFTVSYEVGEQILSFIRLLTDVQFLGINSPILLALNDAPQNNGGLCNAFRSLKEFYFSWGECGLDKAGVVFLLTVLGECPSLNKIQVEFRDLSWHYPRGILPILAPGQNTHEYEEYCCQMEFKEWGVEEETQLSKANTLNQLKTIELYFYYGTKSNSIRKEEGTDFVKRLLLKAVCLESLSLFYAPPKHHVLQGWWTTITPLDLKQQVLTELSSFPRASPYAEIRLG